MVIYLVGKGSAFSPARSTTAAAMAKKKKKKGAGQPPGKGAGANGRKERKIYHWCRSPRRHRLSLPLSLTAVMEVKLWPQTVKGEKKELHVNICSQRLPGLKQIHYILLVLFPPQSQFKNSTFVWDQEDFRESPGRKQTAMEDTEERFAFGAKGVSG